MELIVVLAAAAVVACICLLSVKVFWSGSSSLSDKQLITSLLGQILALLIGVLVGKNIKSRG